MGQSHAIVVALVVAVMLSYGQEQQLLWNASKSLTPGQSELWRMAVGRGVAGTRTVADRPGAASMETLPGWLAQAPA